ncbi:MAG: amidohydrolase family protein [Bryobacteraceae bacterium]
MIVDANVYLGRWPFRRLPDDEPAALAARLRRYGVAQAWTGSFEGVFHKDIGGANARLVRDCRRHGEGLLAPFGSVNPKLPDWREELRRCHEDYKMRGIRLHPNYHGYTLEDPAAGELLRMAGARGLVVQIAAQMEDARVQHPLMQAPPVDLSGLPKLAGAVPQLRLVLLNGLRAVSPQAIRPLAAVPGILFDIAMLEGVGGVARLAEQVSPRRVLFGSYFPFYYFESALLKMREAGLGEAETQGILSENARELLG